MLKLVQENGNSPRKMVRHRFIGFLSGKKCKEMDVSKIGVPQNGGFIMENPIKMDDFGVPLFLETPK